MILPVVGGGQDDPFPVTGEYEGSEPVLASSRPDGSQTPASTPRSGRDRSGHHSLIFFSHPAWGNADFDDQSSIVKGVEEFVACPTKRFFLSSLWSKSKLMKARGLAMYCLSSPKITQSVRLSKPTEGV